MNFYHKFIKDFSVIARPLHELTGNTPWEWLPHHQAAFDTLKNVILDATILHTPYDTGKFKIEADSLDFAVGGTLSQLQEGCWKPIAFLSKSLSPAERNYKIYDKELLAIIICLDKWCQYILGAPKRFEVWSDHKNLEYFRKPQNINYRQARWVSILADYGFSLHHLPGSHNLAADALSWLPIHNDGSNDSAEVVILKPTYFQVWATEEVDSLETCVCSAQDLHDLVVAKNWLRKPDQWKIDDDGNNLGQGQALCSEECRPIRRNPTKPPWLSPGWSPGASWHSESDWENLLLARPITRRPPVCEQLHGLPEKQNISTTHLDSPPLPHSPFTTLGSNLSWPHRAASSFQWLWCDPKHHQPLLQNGGRNPHVNHPHIPSACRSVQVKGLLILWHFQEDHIRPRPTIRKRIHAWHLSDTQYQTESLDSLSSQNQCTGQKDEPQSRPIPSHVCELSPGWLDQLATSGPIHAEQSSKHVDREVCFLPELWETPACHIYRISGSRRRGRHSLGRGWRGWYERQKRW